jgi:hypothetical protein
MEVIIYFVLNTLLDSDQTVGVNGTRGPMRGTPPIKYTTTDNTRRRKYANRVYQKKRNLGIS